MLSVGIIIGSVIVGTISITKASSNAELTICVTKDGTMHLVGNSFKRSDCKKNEQLISFNAQGPKGDKGDTGATGAQGLQGIAGPMGPIGPQGIPGEGITIPDPGTVVGTSSSEVSTTTPVADIGGTISSTSTSVVVTDPNPSDVTDIITSTSTTSGDVVTPPTGTEILPIVEPVDVPPFLYIGGSN